MDTSFLIIFTVFAAAHGQVYHRETPLNIYDLRRFSYFDTNILGQLSTLESDNWVISPASIKTTLGIVYEGANGTTASEINDSMGLPRRPIEAKRFFHMYYQSLKNNNSPVKMKSASRILRNQALPLLPAYEDAVSSFFETKVDAVDPKQPYEVVNNVNYWVSNYTKGLIPSIVETSSITPNFAAIILNAVYFKGDWKMEFHPDASFTSCFRTKTSRCVRTNYMAATATYKYGINHLLRAAVLQVPYSDPSYSMIFLLPLDASTELTTLAKALPFNQIETILDTLQETEVTVTIPKFTIEYSINLVPVLEKLGIKKAFSSESDLSGMFQSSQKATISGIFHKAKIEVNEKGTIAAGSTVVFVETLSTSQNVRFNANHPFFFFVHNNKSGIVFEGQFSNPSELSKVKSKEDHLIEDLTYKAAQPPPDNKNRQRPMTLSPMDYGYARQGLRDKVSYFYSTPEAAVFFRQ